MSNRDLLVIILAAVFFGAWQNNISAGLFCVFMIYIWLFIGEE